MPVTGTHVGKIEAWSPCSKWYTSKMVLLSEVKNQYPWLDTVSALSDKEILTQSVEENSMTWRLPLLPCLPGFAYVGFRVNTFMNPRASPVSAKTVQGADDMPLFGVPYDEISIKAYPTGYIPFNFPIVSRLCHLNEDEIHLVLTFDEAISGRVEIIAQKFDDLPVDDFKVKYYYKLTEEDGLLLQTNNYISFGKCDRISRINYYPSSIRLQRLDLDQNAP
jgi:hypothetical protein